MSESQFPTDGDEERERIPGFCAGSTTGITMQKEKEQCEVLSYLNGVRRYRHRLQCGSSDFGFDFFSKVPL